MSKNTVVFDSPGSHQFTVPDGVTKLNVRCWGGGGAGGGRTTGNFGSGGGAGGAYSEREFDVSPEEVIDLVVAEPKTATATSSASSNTGEPSWFFASDITGCVAGGGVGAQGNNAAGALTSGVIRSDTFDRANSSSTLGTSSSGHVWKQDFGVLGIDNNAAYAPDGGSGIAVLDTDETEATVQITVAGGSNTERCGLLIRGDHAAGADAWRNCYRFQRSTVSGEASFIKVTSSSIVFEEIVEQQIATGDVLKMTASGNEIKCFINGDLKVTHNSSDHNDHTAHGMSITGGSTLDDFSISIPVPQSFGDLFMEGGNGGTGTSTVSGGGGGAPGTVESGGLPDGNKGGLGGRYEGAKGRNGRGTNGAGHSAPGVGAGAIGAYRTSSGSHAGGTGAQGRVEVEYTSPDGGLEFVGSDDTWTATDNSGQFSLRKPEGTAAGDLMIGYAVTYAGQSQISTPEGWDLVRLTSEESGSTIAFAVMTRRFVAGDPAEWTDGLWGSASTRRAAAVCAYRGAGTLIDENATSSASGGDSLTTPVVTSTTEGQWRITAFAYQHTSTVGRQWVEGDNKERARTQEFTSESSDFVGISGYDSGLPVSVDSHSVTGLLSNASSARVAWIGILQDSVECDLDATLPGLGASFDVDRQEYEGTLGAQLASMQGDFDGEQVSGLRTEAPEADTSMAGDLTVDGDLDTVALIPDVLFDSDARVLVEMNVTAPNAAVSASGSVFDIEGVLDVTAPLAKSASGGVSTVTSADILVVTPESRTFVVPDTRTVIDY